MAYKKIKSYTMSEAELRQLWKDEYCNKAIVIKTIDNVEVSFYEDMFDHVFYESDNRKKSDKSILSLNRLEKILWIKETLVDDTAILKQGWDKNTKTYDNERRVALVKNNYVVVIRFTAYLKAKFVTAYEINDDENLDKVKNSPEWKRDSNYVKIDKEENKE